MPQKKILPESENAYLIDAPFMERILFAKRHLFVGVFITITVYLGCNML